MGHLPNHGNRTSHSLFGCFDTLWLLLSTGNIFIIDVNVGTRTVYTYITPLPICLIKFPAPQITSDNSATLAVFMATRFIWFQLAVVSHMCAK